MLEGIKINLIAGGAMSGYLPDDFDSTSKQFSCADQASVQDVLDTLSVPPSQPLMVIVNDAMVTRPDFISTLLSDGDTLSLMPPITAG